MSEKRFTLQEFKKWFSSQEDMSKFFNIGADPQIENDEYAGRKAKPRVNERKLLEKIQCDNDPESLIQDFIENGGEIISSDKKLFYIETSIGSFYLPKFCVKVKKN